MNLRQTYWSLQIQIIGLISSGISPFLRFPLGIPVDLIKESSTLIEG